MERCLVGRSGGAAVGCSELQSVVVASIRHEIRQRELVWLADLQRGAGALSVGLPRDGAIGEGDAPRLVRRVDVDLDRLVGRRSENHIAPERGRRCTHWRDVDGCRRIACTGRVGHGRGA